MRSRFLSISVLLGLVLSAFLVTSQVLADTSVTTPAQLYYSALNTVAGNPRGTVTIVEFFDYNCEYCHRIPGILNNVLDANKNVRIVYRDYPVLGPGSQYAARAALAAAEQGRYLAFHNALFATRGPLTDATIAQLASSLGINIQKLNQGIRSQVVSRQLQSNAVSAYRLGINGVPVLVVAATPSKAQRTVNAYMLVSPSYSDLQEAINNVSRVNNTKS